MSKVKICVQESSDLTQDNLNKIFQYYFQDNSATVTVKEGGEVFVGKNDQLQSDIKRWTVSVARKDESDVEISFIVKTTLTTSFHRFNSRIARQFFSETFWYKHALPVLKQIHPDIANISPDWYFAYCNYEDSFRPDWVDNNCNMIIRQLHHKDEVGIILMENVAVQVKFMKKKGEG